CCMSCSGSDALNPVEGKVLYNNEPIAGVLVTFHPKGADINTVLPVGQTKEDGTFTLSTGKQEGAPAGEYVVTAVCPQQGERTGAKGLSMQRFKPEDRFNGVYANEANSSIKVEIKKGKNQLEPFKLQ